MDKREEEHSPYYDPDEIWDENIPGVHWVILPVAVALILALLMGCDDFDRRLAEQEYREKVFNACVPEQGQRIVVIRDDSALHFTTIDISAGRYGRKFPHTEIRVATIEEL